jgi:hypothetical protein
LRGELKTDFFALLDRHKAEVAKNETKRVQEESHSSSDRQEASHKEEMQKLLVKHEADRRDLIRKHETEVSRIRECFNRLFCFHCSCRKCR